MTGELPRIFIGGDYADAKDGRMPAAVDMSMDGIETCTRVKHVMHDIGA